MTTLEARVASLEHAVTYLIAALEHSLSSQSLFMSTATAQMLSILQQVKQLRDDLNEGDEWKDFG